MRHWKWNWITLVVVAIVRLTPLSYGSVLPDGVALCRQMYCDVAVIGGGAGGVGAAIEAARHGKHVILFEKGVSLGGLATNGYVPQIAGNVEGICLEFAKRMDELGYLKHQDKEDGEYHSPVFDPEMGKVVLEEMVQRAGARIMYDCTCFKAVMNEDGTRISQALFQTKGGYLSVHADIFIDATGDAILADMAGVPNEVGGRISQGSICQLLSVHAGPGQIWRCTNKLRTNISVNRGHWVARW